MPTYYPKVLGSVEALQWTGDWEAMSLFCYGEVHECTDEFHDSDAPVVADGKDLSVLVDGSEQIFHLHHYVVKHVSGTSDAIEYEVWKRVAFEAAFYVNPDGSPA